MNYAIQLRKVAKSLTAGSAKQFDENEPKRIAKDIKELGRLLEETRKITLNNADNFCTIGNELIRDNLREIGHKISELKQLVSLVRDYS